MQVQQFCIKCGVCMGKYFCATCKLFDDDVSGLSSLCYILFSIFYLIWSSLFPVSILWCSGSLLYKSTKNLCSTIQTRTFCLVLHPLACSGALYIINSSLNNCQIRLCMSVELRCCYMLTILFYCRHLKSNTTAVDVEYAGIAYVLDFFFEPLVIRKCLKSSLSKVLSYGLANEIWD